MQTISRDRWVVFNILLLFVCLRNAWAGMTGVRDSKGEMTKDIGEIGQRPKGKS